MTYRHHTERRYVEQSEVDHIEQLWVVFPAVRYAYCLCVAVAQIVVYGLHPNELGGAVGGARDPNAEDYQLQEIDTINLKN